ncbi:uncharacterized protein LOC117178671 [Belonocnema kinseyi]|uniref:uncharacterized protein LOC117178671 n=1 Tax=Belonocnema kinseyi TaxID=2817044 RepID=UPI00143CD69D|nr:uncharacterized protein LOC117178671 [Belonocnema kinseyi]
MDISKLCGKCVDGTANIGRDISGLQKRIRQDEPTALYIHCRPHTVSLVVQDAMKGVLPVKNFLGILKEAIKFIRDFLKRLAQFEELLTDDSPDLMPFCLKMWLLRIKSAKRMYNKTVYNSCLNFFEEKRDDRESDISACAKAAGLFKRIDSF